MKNWEKSLDKFCQIAKINNIDYYLIGSITASVRNIDIIPNDIDLIIDIDDFEKTKRVFNEYVVEPFIICDQQEPIKHFGIIKIENFNIEISACPKNEYGRHRIETICWNGHIIKSQNLEMLEKVYLKYGRKDKAKK